MKIFWSWQSDRTQRICRHFVKEALEAAAQRVAIDLELDESNRPEVDHDTRGEAGMVDIVATILRKIEESTVFVADMTPIARAEQGKLVANPNVLDRTRIRDEGDWTRANHSRGEHGMGRHA